jgi:transcriptional antiterminator RfaH
MQQVCAQGAARWYVIYTKPQQERAVESLLNGRGLETYLPSLKVARRHQRRTRTRRPFFSCYLLAHLNLAQVPLSSINWAPGVKRVVSFGGQPAVVPDQVVDWLKRQLAATDPKEYYRGAPLRPGDRLRVKEGPLRHLEVIFDQRLSSGDRARVFIDILGRLTSCDIDLDCLERA